MKEFIERFTVKNYGCVKDVSVELTPLHAFIGPNDSGKSTLLRAMRTITQLARGIFDSDGPFNPQLTDAEYVLGIAYNDKLVYHVSTPGGKLAELAYVAGTTELLPKSRNGLHNFGLLGTQSDVPQVIELARRLSPARFVRLYADSLRQPTALVLDGDPVRFLDERGLGLPAIYDVIINHNVEAFLKILAEVRRLFPSVARLGLKNVSSSQKVMEVTLHGERRISANAMSEGLLYYLAFAALPYLEPASVILVEEPENGLHPARIAEVMRVLREVSKTTQVLIATHSPLVINEMKPEEVSVVTRPPEKGTQVTRIDKSPDFEDRAKVYALGELWLSYADGEYESPLLEGGPRP